MYLKRNKVPKTWPITRKGSIYLVIPSHNKKNGIPLLIALRDMLEIVKNRKEAKKILNEKKIKINNKIIRDEKYPLILFDKLEVGNQIYQMMINENKKFELKEVEKLDTKVSKIINKKVLDKGKIQVNLNDGNNFLTKEKMNTGDSVVMNLKENKIEKIIPLKTDAEIFVIGGKHLGKSGKIKKIQGKLAEIKTKTEKIKVNLNYLIAI